MKQTRQEQTAQIEEEVDLLTADSTKAHGYGGKKNDVAVILGKNGKTGEKTLLGLGVNMDWKTFFETQFTGRAKVAVSDNEPSLRKVLVERSGEYQACVLHCICDVKFYLWQAGLSKQRRNEIVGRVEEVVWMLRNSVEKHVVLGDFKRLRWRVDWALLELKKISGELLGEGLETTARFVCNLKSY